MLKLCERSYYRFKDAILKRLRCLASLVNVLANNNPATVSVNDGAVDVVSPKAPSLPDNVEYSELLARNLIGGAKKSSLRKLFLDPTTKKNAAPRVFLDERFPREISINRISTLTCEAAHQLGVDQRNEDVNRNPGQNKYYHGFAALIAQICINEKCALVKQDYGGTKPYHANIIYPRDQKEDDMLIANIFSMKAEVILYSGQGCPPDVLT